LRLARQALRTGGGAPTVLNAANEVAVQAFLDQSIGFLDIARIVEATIESFGQTSIATLDEVFALDAEARRRAAALVTRSSAPIYSVGGMP